MKLLNLNCQRALNPNFKDFFRHVLRRNKHKVFLLQEASDEVIALAKKYIGKTHDLVQHQLPDGSMSELCIVHSKKFTCVDHVFLHFEDSDATNFGILMAVFMSKRFSLLTATIHLPAHLKPSIRYRAITRAKEVFESFRTKHPHIDRVILAGDFNSILPWEHARNKNMLASILSPVINKKGYTYHTSRLESNDFSSLFVRFLAKIGLSFRTTLDHVFVNHRLIQRGFVHVQSQDINVSDHLPIQIEIR